MPTLNLTRNRLGALALGVSALLFFSSLLYVPIDPSGPAGPGDLGGIGALWQTGWLFILGMTLFPFGVLAMYAGAKPGSGRLALLALILLLLAVGPLQVFAGLDTLGLAPIRHLYFQQSQVEHPESFQVLQRLLVEITQQASLLPRSGLWAWLGLFSCLIVGLLFLDIGMLVFSLAVWRRGGLLRWASVLYTLGCWLFIGAVFAFASDPIRVATAVIGGIGGLGVAWGLWQQPPSEAA